MSGGTKRNTDKLNTLGIVVVGICGAVLVYVSIAFLQAFYMNDSSDVQTMADYGGQDTQFQRVRAEELSHIGQCANVMAAAGGAAANQHSIPIETAMRLVADDARKDAALLVPAIGRADVPTIKAQFDRPVPLAAPAPAPADPNAVPAPGGAVPTDGATTSPGTANPAAPAAGAGAPGAVAPAPTGGTVPAGAATTPPAPVSPPPPAPGK